MASAGIKITQDAHDKLIKYVQAIQQKQKQFSDWRDKLEEIDEAYAKHKVDLGEDPECTTRMGKKETDLAIKVPVVNSEVDSVAAFLAKTFVNRVPLFPVLADDGDAEAAMSLQALISKDARHQRWGRQILLFLTKAARYNVCGIEVEDVWQKDLSIGNSEEELNKIEVSVTDSAVTKMMALDMYNALFDYRVAPADIAIEGEYAGYNKLVSKIWLKKYGNMLSLNKQGYNLKEAYSSSMVGMEDYWFQPPDVTNIRQTSATDEEDWFNWMGILDNPTPKMASSSYFLTRLYCRIIPGEFSIGTSQHPIIIKLTIINMKHIVAYEEVVTPLDVLPILFCDLREDGFEYQTKSSGENVLPYQETATELLSTRMEGSKRAIADRAIYDPLYVDKRDVNSRVASAKIPLKKKLSSSGDRPRLSDVYYPIPFEGQGVVNAMTDMQTILSMKDDVTGANFAFRGQQTPGNRTLGEFDQLNTASDDKALPYALRLEEQVFTLMKLIVKSNLLRSTSIEEKTLDPDTGSVVNNNPAALRSALMDFRLTDGLRPKTAIRDPNVLSTAMQLIQNSPELQREYGIGGVFQEIMGVLDIDISKHKLNMGAQNGNTAGGPVASPQAAPTGPANAPTGGGLI